MNQADRKEFEVIHSKIDQLQTDYEEAKNILAKQSVSKTTKPKQINK